MLEQEIRHQGYHVKWALLVELARWMSDPAAVKTDADEEGEGEGAGGGGICEGTCEGAGEEEDGEEEEGLGHLEGERDG